MGRVDVEAIGPFLRRVLRRFRPAHVILFGSRARGGWTKYSDYDLVIVSEAFESVRRFDRILSVRSELRRGEEFDIDVICLTPEEFERARDNPFTGVVYVAAREGVDLLPRLKGRRAIV